MGNGGSYQLCTLSAALPVTSNDIPVSYADGTWNARPLCILDGYSFYGAIGPRLSIDTSEKIFSNFPRYFFYLFTVYKYESFRRYLFWVNL